MTAVGVKVCVFPLGDGVAVCFPCVVGMGHLRYVRFGVVEGGAWV